MKPCDKASTDPVRHNGPFEFLDTFLDDEVRVAIERCGECGNIVLRRPKEDPASSTRPGPEN